MKLTFTLQGGGGFVAAAGRQVQHASDRQSQLACDEISEQGAHADMEAAEAAPAQYSSVRNSRRQSFAVWSRSMRQVKKARRPSVTSPDMLRRTQNQRAAAGERGSPSA